MMLFICCPISIVVTIVCCVFCCVVGQSNRQLNKKRAGDASQTVPLTTAPTEVPVAGQPGQSYPLQPTASAPPLDAAGVGGYHPPDQCPQPSAPTAYPTDPTIPSEEPPPYPGTETGSDPIEINKEPYPSQ